MKRAIRSLWTWGAVLVSVPLVSASSPIESLRLLDGVEFVSATRFAVDETLILSSATVISSDEVLISKPLITMGHRLSIETRRLIFEGEGKILAFPEGSAAANGPDGLAGAVGVHGQSNCRHYVTGEKERVRRLVPGRGGELYDFEYVDVDVKITRAEDGLAGGTGRSAEIPGSQGKSAGEIFISAAKVEGHLLIDGRGQQGGAGGKGGRGGEGGRGANGRNGKASTFGFGGHSACDGGLGGRGGDGGKGGDGGVGGSGAHIRLEFASRPESQNIIVAGGSGGPGGEGGAPGNGGQGGTKGASAKGFLIVVKIGSSGADNDGTSGNDPSAKHYPPQPMPTKGADGVQGAAGSMGTLEEVYADDMETLRVNAVNAFLEFQLERTFWALVEKTYSQISDQMLVNSLSEELSREFLSTDESVIHSASLLGGEEIAYFESAWKVFDEVFKDVDRMHSTSQSLSESYQNVRESLSLLKSAKTSESNLRRTQDALDQLAFRRLGRLEDSFKLIAKECEAFTSAFETQWKTRVSQGWILNRHFVVPACLQLDKIQQNPLMPLVVQATGALQVSPAQLSRLIKQQEVELYATSLKNPFARYWNPFSSSAFATENSEPFPQEAVWSLQALNRISLDHLASAFLNTTTVGRSGIVTTLHFTAIDLVKTPGDLEVLMRVNAANWKALLKEKAKK
jgi:hypothetical protein